MFCPRCGRPVNPEANFCGGCGLSRVEIEKYLNKTAPQQSAPQPEMPKAEPVFTESESVKAEEVPQAEVPKAEPVFTEPESVKAEEVPQAEVPQCEAPEAEPVFAEPETVKEEPSFAQTEAAREAQQTNANNCTYAYSYKKAENTADQHSYGSTAANSSTVTDAAYTAPQPQPKTEAPLTTVDYIWMFVISSLPIIGLIYIIYLAVQDNNTNKRSFARATLIVGLFSVIIAFVFAVGIVAAGLM